MRVLLCLLVLLCWQLAVPALAAEGGDEAVSTQIAKHLSDLDPGWYNPVTDTWLRILPLEDRQDSEDSGESSFLAGGFSLSSLLLIVVLIIAAGALATLLVMGAQVPEPEPVRHLGAYRGGRDDNEEALAAPRFLDLDLDEVERADLLAALTAAISTGDPIRMVICALAVRLVLLDRGGMIALRPGATNRQLLKELQQAVSKRRQGDALVADVRVAIELFEEVYFGAHAAGLQRAQAVAEVEPFRVLLRQCRSKAASQQGAS